MLITWLTLALLTGGLQAPPPVAPKPIPAADQKQAVSIGTPCFLLPDDPTLAPGQHALLAWGDVGVKQPWPRELVRHLFVRSEGVQENLDTVESPDGIHADLLADGLGAIMVGIAIMPRDARIDAQDAARLGGLPPGLEAGDVIPLVRCGKVMLRRDDDQTRGLRSPVVSSKGGQETELRPMIDPTVAIIGSTIPVRAFAGSTAAPGANVRASVLATAADGTRSARLVQESKADASGIATLTMSEPGIWLVEFEALARSARSGGEEAPGAMTWFQASLVFEVPAP